MRTLILAVLLFAAQTVHADDMGLCRAYGLVYQAAAYARDLGNPPIVALEFTEPYAKHISETMRKAIINQVYFSPAFAYARGDALRLQMTRECLTGPNKWEPLK